MAQAIYKYEACTEDELSFPVGAVIKILDKNDRDDDGWWKGELNGKVGVFPALVVEEIGSKHNKQDSYEVISIELMVCQTASSSLIVFCFWLEHVGL